MDQDAEQAMQKMFTRRHFNEQQQALYRNIMEQRAKLYSNPELCLERMKTHKVILNYIPREWWQESDFCLKAIQAWDDSLEYIPQKMWQEIEFCREALKASEYALDYVPEEVSLLTVKENLKENLKLTELATLRKNRSGLPVNLYLDDSESWSKSGFWRRIKFQPDKEDYPNTRNMIPMSIDDNPQILVKNAKIDLSVSEIEQIMIFVKNNKDLLLQLADATIDIFDFIEKMKTIKLTSKGGRP
jgi:hypothetical protein